MPSPDQMIERQKIEKVNVVMVRVDMSGKSLIKVLL